MGQIDYIISNSILEYLNESIIKNSLSYKIVDDTFIFFNENNEEVGGLCFNPSTFDEIYSEYQDSVEDFDSNIMRKFSYNNTIVNIEDVWVNRKFQKQGLFREILSIGIKLLRQKYHQFILRACSDNGFPDNKLVEIYSDFGFIPYQDTEEDGTIMFYIS